MAEEGEWKLMTKESAKIVPKPAEEGEWKEQGWLGGTPSVETAPKETWTEQGWVGGGGAGSGNAPPVTITAPRYDPATETVNLEPSSTTQGQVNLPTNVSPRGTGPKVFDYPIQGGMSDTRRWVLGYDPEQIKINFERMRQLGETYEQKLSAAEAEAYRMFGPNYKDILERQRWNPSADPLEDRFKAIAELQKYAERKELTQEEYGDYEKEFERAYGMNIETYKERMPRVAAAYTEAGKTYDAVALLEGATRLMMGPTWPKEGESSEATMIRVMNELGGFIGEQKTRLKSSELALGTPEMIDVSIVTRSEIAKSDIENLIGKARSIYEPIHEQYMFETAKPWLSEELATWTGEQPIKIKRERLPPGTPEGEIPFPAGGSLERLAGAAATVGAGTFESSLVFVGGLLGQKNYRRPVDIFSVLGIGGAHPATEKWTGGERTFGAFAGGLPFLWGESKVVSKGLEIVGGTVGTWVVESAKDIWGSTWGMGKAEFDAFKLTGEPMGKWGQRYAAVHEAIVHPEIEQGGYAFIGPSARMVGRIPKVGKAFTEFFAPSKEPFALGYAAARKVGTEVVEELILPRTRTTIPEFWMKRRQAYIGAIDEFSGEYLVGEVPKNVTDEMLELGVRRATGTTGGYSQKHFYGLLDFEGKPIMTESWIPFESTYDDLVMFSRRTPEIQGVAAGRATASVFTNLDETITLTPRGGTLDAYFLTEKRLQSLMDVGSARAGVEPPTASYFVSGLAKESDAYGQYWSYPWEGAKRTVVRLDDVLYPTMVGEIPHPLPKVALHELGHHVGKTLFDDISEQFAFSFAEKEYARYTSELLPQLSRKGVLAEARIGGQDMFEYVVTKGQTVKYGPFGGTSNLVSSEFIEGPTVSQGAYITTRFTPSGVELTPAFKNARVIGYTGKETAEAKRLLALWESIDNPATAATSIYPSNKEWAEAFFKGFAKSDTPIIEKAILKGTATNIAKSGYDSYVSELGVSWGERQVKESLDSLLGVAREGQITALATETKEAGRVFITQLPVSLPKVVGPGIGTMLEPMKAVGVGAAVLSPLIETIGRKTALEPTIGDIMGPQRAGQRIDPIQAVWQAGSNLLEEKRQQRGITETITIPDIGLGSEARQRGRSGTFPLVGVGSMVGAAQAVSPMQAVDQMLNMKQMSATSTLQTAARGGINFKPFKLLPRLGKERQQKEGGMGFDVFLKLPMEKRGKGRYRSRGYRRLNANPLSWASAMGLGMKEADVSARASFFVKQSTTAGGVSNAFDALYSEKRHKFRNPIRRGVEIPGTGRYIEKAAGRIDMPGEKREISNRGNRRGGSWGLAPVRMARATRQRGGMGLPKMSNLLEPSRPTRGRGGQIKMPKMGGFDLLKNPKRKGKRGRKRAWDFF